MFGNLTGGDGSSDKNKMHPEDLRNMLIFFILAAVIYFTYDAYVLRPQAEAVRQQRLMQAEALKNNPSAEEANKEPRPRQEAISDSPRIAIQNAKISGSLNLKGGRLDDLSLNDYYDTIEHKDHVFLLSPKDTVFPRHVSWGWVAEGNIALPGDDTLWRAEGNDKLTPGHPVTLKWDNGQGQVFENTFEIDDAYGLTLTQKVKNTSGTKVVLHPYNLVSQTGVHPDFKPNWIVHEGSVGVIGDELQQAPYLVMRKKTSQEFSGEKGWAGVTDKYWLIALVPPQGETMRYRYSYNGLIPTGKQKDTGKYQVDFTGDAVTIEPGQSAQSQSHIFAGAKKVVMLEEYAAKFNAPKLDLAVDFGWFWFLSKPFFFALHYLGAWTNTAIAMVVLTLIIRGAVFPLTNMSYRSFAKMKVVAPQVAELRKSAGDDKAKLQEELVKLYEREGVNPMSGCLPIFAQIPIFFALYKVLVNTIEMRQAPFFGWIKDMSAADPTNVFNLFGAIPWDPPHFLHLGAWPCMLLLTMLVQKKLNPPPQDPIQRDMANYFPFIMAYVMSGFASGLVIYWTLGAVIGIIQQIIIMRSLGVPIHLFGQTEAEKTIDKQIDKGPSAHPLIEMAEKNAEEALFGDPGSDAPTQVSQPKRKRKKKK